MQNIPSELCFSGAFPLLWELRLKIRKRKHTVLPNPLLPQPYFPILAVGKKKSHLLEWKALHWKQSGLDYRLN